MTKNDTSNLKELREKLFSLRFRTTVERKNLTPEEIKDLQSEINSVKKEIAHCVQENLSNEKENIINGGMKL